MQQLLKPKTKDIFRGAVHGIFWTYLSFAGSKLLIFASTVILARLLMPAEFGQVGFALLVISYLDTIGDLGMSEALIYEQKEPETAADVAFIINLIMGVFWFALATAVAPWLAAFFKDPSAVPIFRAMAWVFLLTGLGETHDYLLQRTLAFQRRLIPDFTRALVKGIFSVILALLGWGVWSLVWGQLLGAAAATMVLWRVVPWRPKLKFPLKQVRRMLHYGGQIVSVHVLNAVVQHMDYVIVGRMLGSAALGFYSLAYRIPEMVITMMIWVVGHVTFPTYSRLREDSSALRRAFLATLRYLSLFSLPAGIGLAMLGAGLVHAFYGAKWAPSIPVLQALAITASLRSLGSNAGDVYKATGRPGILTLIGLARAAVLVPLLIFSARFGIAGVAVTQMMVTGASTFLSLFIAGKVLSIPMKSIALEFKPAFWSSMAMVASLYAIEPVLSGWSHLLRLIIAVSAGFGVYLLATWMISPDTVRTAKGFLRPQVAEQG